MDHFDNQGNAILARERAAGVPKRITNRGIKANRIHHKARPRHER